MASSRRPGLIGRDPFASSPVTPGLLGVGDAAAPFTSAALIGNTPGLLGRNDWADPNHFHLAAATARTSPELQLSFSEWAEKRMWDLLKDYDSQVGSEYPGIAPDKSRTDCITYVRQVLEYAYGKVGRPDLVRKVRNHYQYGHKLAAILVGTGWKAHYWNPDVKRPRDKQSEHPVSYKDAVKTNRYYDVPVSGFIINYNPTPAPEQSLLDRVRGATTLTQTAKKGDAFNRFSRVRFAYGIARGGTHTFLCSYGMIFEVHWDRIGEGLYERSPFYDYRWLSGLMLTPLDSDFSSDPN